MMTGRAKRNLSLARQRRTERARAAYAQARAELERIAAMGLAGSLFPLAYDTPKPEWHGRAPKGVTVQ